ncbi:GNAT family N-acetyltransferase [Tessaracoccus sp. OH4464_COT-324]|uniref:GNAT family N-acetyltransferase n=1 Tax=Tessaracoccus sp. OH4464_COT-324 TaxID=2491059 RepID=UPI000F6378F1|nr:GNAT family N-acetyltransferase [Tessaracoccus sp. OH4464_COT-324]RRD47747.1 GNAT family N-acetyltransferase [Tessaracoccus sp. OH4464_COT-324]
MGAVTQVGPGDVGQVYSFLERAPYENLMLAARLAEFGLDRRRLGRLLAYRNPAGEISALCLDGGTVFVTGYDSAAVAHFVRELGSFRIATSIVGPSFSALGLFVGLSARWGDMWAVNSNIRYTQPLMVLDEPVAGDVDPRVVRLDESVYDSYLAASVDMYTAEIGSSPFKYGPGYETYVLERLRQGDAWGIVENDEVIFKADLGPRFGDQVQVQGVWVRPDLRGRGIAVPALAAMLTDVQRGFPVVSLYVNDFNLPAIRTYERLGFRTVATLSTIHY